MNDERSATQRFKLKNPVIPRCDFNNNIKLGVFNLHDKYFYFAMNDIFNAFLIFAYFSLHNTALSDHRG